MRAHWHALHAELERSATRYSSHQHFIGIRQRFRDLRTFSDSGAMLSALHGRDGDPGRKNAILRALIAAAQQRDPFAETAQVLALLALWPGLDAVRGRLVRHFRSDPERLSAELAGRLTEAIATMDLKKVNCVAATLLRNLERDLRRMLRNEWARAADTEAAETLTDAGSGKADPSFPMLVRDLDRIIEGDAALIVGVCILGMSQKEAGQAIGLSHDAARKRYQRAIEKLRATYAQ